MRITITQRSLHHCISYLVMVIIFWSIVLPSVAAASLQPLLIEVYDSDTGNALQSDVVFEGKSYDIMITNESEDFLSNVTIKMFNNTNITTNETPYITIEAPLMKDYPSFTINASKEGYSPAERTLTIMKGTLSISTSPLNSVKEKEEFQVTIKDQDGNPVEDALVSIDPNGSYVGTDAQGIAYLNAPVVSQNENIIIRTMKDGYIDSSKSMLVEIVVPTIGNSMLIQIAPILFAAVAVIFAVFYVRWRKRNQKNLPSQQAKPEAAPKQIPEDSASGLERQRTHDQASYRVHERGPTSLSASSSKVEEIRIPLQEKRRETTVLSSEPPSEVSAPQHDKDENEWFKGQEYMRYKLDEMTGSIDRKNEGKWFEGERDIESKVDEALKKQSKRKKVDQRENQ